MTNNTPKYTSGEWSVYDKDCTGNIGDISIYTHTKYGNTLHIARIYNVLGEQETKANAHLIATAPEMLEALKVALQADQNQANHGYYRRIIAKAEGRR
jgi:hypothetical protein